MWNTIAPQIIAVAEHEPADEEDVRFPKVVAQRFLDRVNDAHDLRGNETYNQNGDPARRSDGSIVFSFAAVWEPMSIGQDHITRRELSKLLAMLKCATEWVGPVDGRRRVKVLPPHWRAALTALIESAKK